VTSLPHQFVIGRGLQHRGLDFTSPVLPPSHSLSLSPFPSLSTSHDPLHHGIEVRAGLGRAREATPELLKVREWMREEEEEEEGRVVGSDGPYEERKRRKEGWEGVGGGVKMCRGFTLKGGLNNAKFLK